MLHLTFITVGDLPNGPFREIAEKFKKQLRPYVKLDHKIVKDASRIERQIPDGDYVVVLDERGKHVTSQFAAQIMKRMENQGTHVTAILGGPKGLPDSIKQRADLLFALSKLTTTHDLAHIFFLEQLYRIMTIVHGKEYHY